MIGSIYLSISKGMTFFELFLQALPVSLFYQPVAWILLIISIGKSEHLSSIIHRRNVAYALINFIPIFLISQSSIAILKEHKPSDYLLDGTLYIIPIIIFSITIFIQSTKHKEDNSNDFGSKFQQINIAHQVITLILLYLLIYYTVNLLFYILLSVFDFFKNDFGSYILIPYLFTLIIFTVNAFILNKKLKKLEGKRMPLKCSDYIPVVALLTIFSIISNVTIGDFICAIPKFNSYFSCGTCCY